jgi:hypothetical protein
MEDTKNGFNATKKTTKIQTEEESKINQKLDFSTLKNRREPISLFMSAHNIKKKIEIIESVKIDLKKRKLRFIKAETQIHKDSVDSVVEPLFGLLTQKSLPPQIVNANYDRKNLIHLSETNLFSSQFDLALGIRFSGLLHKKIRAGNFKKRFFCLMVDPVINPNLVVTAKKKSISTIRTISEHKNCNFQNNYQYQLIEYSSVTVSKWGILPIGFKRRHYLKNIIAIRTTTSSKAKGLFFKLTLLIDISSNNVERRSTNKINNNKYQKQSNNTKENQKDEGVMLQEYMQILQKNHIELMSPKSNEPIVNENIKLEEEIEEYSDQDSEDEYDSESDDNDVESERNSEFGSQNDNQNELFSIIKQAHTRHSGKKVVSITLKASSSDERLQWVTILSSLSRPDIYVNTINY